MTDKSRRGLLEHYNSPQSGSSPPALELLALQASVKELLNLARKQLRSVVAVDLSDQRVVVESLQVQFGGFWNRGLFEHDFNRRGIDGHIFVPDLHTFLMAFLEQFSVRDLGVLRVDFHCERRFVDGSFQAVEVA